MSEKTTRRGAIALAAGAAASAPGGLRAAERRTKAPRLRRIGVGAGFEMAYREIGTGDPIVLLHGNPTSSFLWRKIMPYAASRGRAVAPDLIGMGRSDKLPGSGDGAYAFAVQRDFLDAFLAAAGADRRVVLVAHDWGGPLAFDWARRHESEVRAIVFMETFVWRIPADGPDFVLDFFKYYRGPEGARAVLEDNQFVEKVLLSQIGDALSDDEIEEYRRPFRDRGESRRPTLDWPRQVPIGEEPPDVARAFDAFLDFMATSAVPKLWIRAVPGALVLEPLWERVRAWPNLTEAAVAGGHFLQETAPHGVGRALSRFLAQIE